jgi:phosphoribosylglycinamide formyltransferase 1
LVQLAIFASGGGSNALQIIKYFEHNDEVVISLVVSNKKNAGVVQIAEQYGISTLILEKEIFFASEKLLQDLTKIDYVILAGFLWLIPPYLIHHFPDKIINIHPSLLPKYGGKGMYGHYVHEAVKANNELESGMTIHLVNEQFDDGRILFQATCTITEDMTPTDIASSVLALEHLHFAPTIEKYILDKVK